jgi:hypothetical protein
MWRSEVQSEEDRMDLKMEGNPVENVESAEAAEDSIVLRK